MTPPRMAPMVPLREKEDMLGEMYASGVSLGHSGEVITYGPWGAAGERWKDGGSESKLVVR